jgi:hypothetical protein
MPGHPVAADGTGTGDQEEAQNIPGSSWQVAKQQQQLVLNSQPVYNAAITQYAPPSSLDT